MKILSSVLGLTLLLSVPALAQTYSSGDKVQAMNPVTGKVEAATITRVDGGRYLLHSDNASIDDWDVAAADIRAGNSSSSSSGVLGTLPASSGPTPLSSPSPDNNPPSNDNAPSAEPRQ